MLAALVIVLAGCSSDSATEGPATFSPSSERPTDSPSSSAPTSEPADSAGCRLPPDGKAAVAGECTLVDWNAVVTSGNAIELEYFANDPGCSVGLDRVETDEDAETVTLRVLVGFIGDEGASCPTALGSRSTRVALKAPLGDRMLLGCRPQGSFAPAGGYNDPEPRDPTRDCSPA